MFSRFANRIAVKKAERHNIRALEMMDDNQLADIGVTRGNIAHAVRFGR